MKYVLILEKLLELGKLRLGQMDNLTSLNSLPFLGYNDKPVDKQECGSQGNFNSTPPPKKKIEILLRISWVIYLMQKILVTYMKWLYEVKQIHIFKALTGMFMMWPGTRRCTTV